MKLKTLSSAFLGLILISSAQLQAAYTFQRGRLVDVCEAATMSAEDHFKVGSEAYNNEEWEESGKHFSIIVINFPSTSYGQEAFYFLGVSHYFLEEYDFANDAFSNYLKVQGNPRYFQSAIDFKFAIAEQLNCGAKRRILGTKKLPKWGGGESLALQIYDEVIAAVPCSDLAAKSLFSKACLQWRMRNYGCAVESFQMIIKRFPKYELAPDCYVYIGKIYLEQSRYEFQNSDILAFSMINLRKFERDFPREERLCEARNDVMAIQEIYANGLYETGQFYERKGKMGSAIIYYKGAIRQFPETTTADICHQRLECLNVSHCEDKKELKLEDEAVQSDDNELNEELDLDVSLCE